jgi:hypothetical protein
MYVPKPAPPSTPQVTVEKAKTLQARAYLKRALFAEWNLRAAPSSSAKGRHDDSDGLNSEDEEHEPPAVSAVLQVCVNLTTLLQCLTVFGTGARLEMSLRTEGEPLALMLEEGGVITQCDIATLSDNAEPANLLGMSMGGGAGGGGGGGTAVVNRVQLRAALLRDCIGDLDLGGGGGSSGSGGGSGAYVYITFAPEHPYFAFACQGASIKCEIAFPNEADMFVEFDCRETLVGAYALAHFRQALNARNLAHVEQVCKQLSHFDFVILSAGFSIAALSYFRFWNHIYSLFVDLLDYMCVELFSWSIGRSVSVCAPMAFCPSRTRLCRTT